MSTARKLRFIDFTPEVAKFFGRAKAYSYVRPRYSCGSPAMVTDDIALRVADDEKSDYAHILEGIEGAERKKRAEILGLRGIAYVMAEKGSGRNFRWLIFDLITGECFRRHHNHEISRLGYTPYEFLPLEVQNRLNETRNAPDYDRTFWKYEGYTWVKYEPELVRFEL